MTDSLDVRAKRVFDDVIDRIGAERAFHLERLCVGPPALRARVEALLAAAEKDDGFLRGPALTLLPSASGGEPGEQAGKSIGPYTLVELIGEGGFGSVYLAEQSTPVRRRVALKVIKAGMDTKQVIARFEVERQSLALMDHPNIARVLDAGATDSGRPFFVMELVRGEPVTCYCDQQRRSVRQRLELFREVCSAVQHAHQKGIIHRDLKPSNILVTNMDGAALVKVIDFGIAKATASRLTDQTLTELHQRVGTPEYMSPEQAEISGVDIDTRSDIYSLGVLLYELLTGTTPFERHRLAASGFDEMRRILRDEEPARPSARLQTMAASDARLRLPSAAGVAESRDADSSAIEISSRRRTEPAVLLRTLRRDLDWIVLKCLEKDRTRRYETASALADDVGRYLDEQPVLATPPSAGYRLRKFVRRNRIMVIAGTAVLATLIAGIFGTTLGLVWAVREQSRTEAHRIIAKREGDQARAVYEFMRQVLTSVEPQNLGADVRLIDVLAAASATAAQQFADHPLQEAQVRDLLGDVYNKLSLWAESKGEYSQAMALWAQHAGADDPRALSSEFRHAGALLNMSLTPAAERAITVLLPRLEAVLGSDHTTTLDARRVVAIIHRQHGRPDEAERILLELRSHPALADDDYMQIRILHSLVDTYLARPSIEDPAARVAFWRQIAPLGSEWVERAIRHHGPDSIVTLHALAKAAEVTYAQGDFHRAAQACREVLDSHTARLGECHGLRTDAMTTLAVALGRMGQERESAELYLRSIACVRRNSPARSILLITTISDGLRYLDRAGYAADGEALARELSALLGEYAGNHSEFTFDADVYIAEFLSMQGRRDDAETLFAALFVRDPSVQGQRARARLRLSVAAHLRRGGLFEEAESRLAEATELVGDVRHGTWLDLPDDIILGFMDLYDAWGKPDKYAEYRQLRDELLTP